jgi:hypothetical protein
MGIGMAAALPIVEAIVVLTQALQFDKPADMTNSRNF